eukprot:TRINITY_DN10042_c0_g1_i1.p1 TRINITY_DN10042_c0_g1~~TRINITY_DN10042_c0_g1_i1.p1  ORF type:complete len:147 (-),score=35.13 TRINITY_DN10042_c0_g1_i1:363-803(-)
MLIPMNSTSSSSSTSSPSNVMIAPQEIQVMPVDIKGTIEEQVQGKADLMENSKQLQDDQDSVNQEPQKVEQEQGDANIEDFDQFARQSEHQVDLVEMPLPHNPITSSAIKSIVPVVSQEDQVIKVPHIDFIFGDQQWIVNVHELLV